MSAQSAQMQQPSQNHSAFYQAVRDIELAIARIDTAVTTGKVEDDDKQEIRNKLIALQQENKLLRTSQASLADRLDKVVGRLKTLLSSDQ